MVTQVSSPTGAGSVRRPALRRAAMTAVLSATGRVFVMGSIDGVIRFVLLGLLWGSSWAALGLTLARVRPDLGTPAGRTPPLERGRT